ncbi:hypothetical protein SUGI_0937370 [Cryptomeria japonica]|nr:hypothetical protein SUGI_0937370 [Cryptomeria japonica]
MEGGNGSSVELLSATEKETLCRIHKGSFKCGCCMQEESLENSVMEETCDSESVMDSDGTTASFNSHFAVGFNELDRLFIADDEQSTTSSTEDLSEEIYCCGEVGEPIAESCFEYLQKASDEELGIPSNPLRVGDDILKPTVFDLDFDVDGCTPKMADQDQSYYFWLSCLRS